MQNTEKTPSLLIKLITSRSILWSLVKSDLRERYAGSLLGIFWLFSLPLINILIMWFAFGFGLKSQPVSGVPFILWLMCGLFPWSFFSESTMSAMNSIVDKSYLVKKIVFDVELLPIIKLATSSILLIYLLFIILISFLLQGFQPDLYWLQVPYFAMSILALSFSLSLISSTIVIFYRDLGQVITVCLQLGFWVTPIFWNAELLPNELRFVTFFNPVNYVISGLRNSLIYKKWFWEEGLQSIYFWAFILVISLIGQSVFRKLRPHFSDVL